MPNILPRFRYVYSEIPPKSTAGRFCFEPDIYPELKFVLFRNQES
jgi:hypothetical protein